jgi:hypothetical protein
LTYLKKCLIISLTILKRLHKIFIDQEIAGVHENFCRGKQTAVAGKSFWEGSGAETKWFTGQGKAGDSYEHGFQGRGGLY